MGRTKAPAKSARRPDQATQTVAAILQEFARHSFDIDDRSRQLLEEMCESWIEHFLEGASSPGNAELPENWLDWPGVRDFVAHERGREATFVTKSLSDYQDLAHSILTDFTATLQTEQAADGVLRDRIDLLGENARSKTGEELRAEVLSTVAQLTQGFEEKKARQDAQLEALATQVQSLQSELVDVRATAERDAMTTLYNRGAFDQHVATVVENRAATGAEYTLIIADIDHFKALNDNYGHPFGDSVIQSVAACLADAFPQETAFVARYGGEEFAIVCAATITEIGPIAEQVLQQVRGLAFDHEGERVALAISLGLAALGEGEPAPAWIERADKALYSSKQLGRNRVTFAGNS